MKRLLFAVWLLLLGAGTAIALEQKYTSGGEAYVEISSASAINTSLQNLYTAINNVYTTLQTIQGQTITACSGTPVNSATAEASHVLKASSGSLCDVSAQNFTTTAGWLVVIDAASAPGDGGITPLLCQYLPPNGYASIGNGLGNADQFTTGIVAVITSGTTCFTKTTNVITGFIKGKVL